MVLRSLLFAGLCLAALGCPADGPAPVAQGSASGADGTSALEGPDAGGATGTEGSAGELPEDVASVGAVSEWVTHLDRDPRSVHMSWQQDPATTVTLSWSTAFTELGAYAPRAWVVPAALVEGEGDAAVMPWSASFVHEGIGLNYKETLLGIEVGLETFAVWHVEVTGLRPNTEYVYRVGTWEGFDPETGAFTNPDLSEAARFRTGVPKGSREPYHFVMAGDSRGGTDDIAKNIERLAAMEARMWFFNGDMTNGGTQLEWDAWWEAMAPLLAGKVLMPVQGNHEIFANLYYDQMELPKAPDLRAEYQEHAWSVDFGNAHFVGLDSNTDSAVVDQVAWLDADLASARQDPDIDWIFVMFHHAAYSASNHGSSPRVQEHWVPLFEKHSVDVVWNGHDHNYERTKPIRGGEVVGVGEGVVYVVAGGFYSPAYGNGYEWWTETSTHGDKGNYVHVELDGNTLHATAWSGDGTEIIDEFTLTK
jgi:hypothetical protein